MFCDVQVYNEDQSLLDRLTIHSQVWNGLRKTVFWKNCFWRKFFWKKIKSSRALFKSSQDSVKSSITGGLWRPGGSAFYGDKAKLTRVQIHFTLEKGK